MISEKSSLKSSKSSGNRIRGKVRSRRGMTMAEMMLTVAIIAILGGLITVSIIQFRLSLALTQRDAIAKEIFISAQNHLTMAKGEGYLGVTVGKDADDPVYGIKQSDGTYIFVQGPNSQTITDNNENILDQMLPFGAIDETVRKGGSYIIHYRPKTGKVLDVFYCSPGSEGYNYNLAASDFDGEGNNYAMNLVYTTGADGKRTVNDQKSLRKHFKGNKVLGWYGGDGLEDTPAVIKEPKLTVNNGEKLEVVVTNTNTFTFAKCSLIIKGLSSEGRKVIILKTDGSDPRCQYDSDTKTYTYALDDVIKRSNNYNGHFCNLTSDDTSHKFIAGEDIEIQAVAYSNEVYSTVSYSPKVVENSLYQSIEKNRKQAGEEHENDPDTYTAFISSCRHLENLEESVSNTGAVEGTVSSSTSKVITLTAAAQTDDIEWETTLNVCDKDGTVPDGCTGYYPVSHETELIYDGLRHSVKGITTSGYVDAGMFGNVTSGGIKNLRLINFSVTGTTDSGALAGKTNNTNIRNVVAFHENTTAAGKTIKGGTAGGLIGDMEGGTLRYSAAAMYVGGKNTGTTTAGGLIGKTAAGASVKACYSGGHTKNGMYEDKDSKYNVYSTSIAGGLVGDAGNATFKYCYSTCSVRGGTAANTGGFIGTSSATGKFIEQSYSTGLVRATGKDEEKYSNAFIGSKASGGSVDDCWFYEIVNEYTVSSSVKYKGSGIEPPAEGEEPEIVSIDEDADEYQAFVNAQTTWNQARPYDTYLQKHYKNNNDYAYNLMTVTQLMDNSGDEGVRVKDTTPAFNGNSLTGYFVNTHYGDWPVPEMFLLNSN